MWKKHFENIVSNITVSLCEGARSSNLERDHSAMNFSYLLNICLWKNCFCFSFSIYIYFETGSYAVSPDWPQTCCTALDDLELLTLPSLCHHEFRCMTPWLMPCRGSNLGLSAHQAASPTLSNDIYLVHKSTGITCKSESTEVIYKTNTAY